jgi:hypothetical protein
MSADRDEWDGPPPAADFAAWYRKGHAPADPLTGPLPAPDETVAWIPPWDDTPPQGRHAGPVQCNCQTAGCPDAPRMPRPDDPRLLLSCAPGVVTRMSKERVRNGAWVDVPAYSRSAAGEIQKYAVEHLAAIRLEVEHGVLDLLPLFDRSPALHSDPELSRELHRLEADYAADLDDMRRRSRAGEPQPWHRAAMRSVAL